MNLLVWNVRGLNRHPMQNEIRCKIAQLQLLFVGLIETRVRISVLQAICSNTFPPGWSHFSNSQHCNSARICIGWDPLLTVDVLDHSSQFIHCKINFQSSYFAITVCYGCNCSQERQSLWSSLNATSAIISLPWLVLGDFNVVRWGSEKVGGAPPCRSAMQSFNNFIDFYALQELNLQGQHFTWTNSSFGSSRVECVLNAPS